ncbi:OLC1v1031955C1 [Oldenlandia corymbosa var. corymbosa]|uniref:OLC1v1031955C1 n=1 Tax=Oldenlandia corymbosa var. corymbosa TaxID=529605 RepID=A0AAV1CKG7_OLDCO|nr:OLC1v1031955C1 [Oldenlandia corymbosa var. corymbosa]
MVAVPSSTAVATTTSAHLCSGTNRLLLYNGSSTRVISFCSEHFDFPAVRMKPPRRVRLVAKNSGTSEVSADAGEVEVEGSDQKLEQVPTGEPSLISALNVEKALRGIAITDADHYGRLGLQRGCSYDQVSIAYKNKVEEVMNQQLPEEELQTSLDQLKESFLILSTVEERRLYDWSLARTENPDRYKWPFEVDISQTPKDGTPPPQEPEDVETTRLVGYFILGIFVLSIILSITLNQQ